MTRSEFIDALAEILQAADVPTRRWQVEPGGLEDLEIAVDGVVRRLRIVRTGPR